MLDDNRKDAWKMEHIIRNIYIPKMLVKFHAPYMYANDDDYGYISKNGQRNYQAVQKINHVFADKDEEERLKDKVMVGIHAQRDGGLSMSSVKLDGSV